MLYGSPQKFINSFKYFGHITCNSRSDDDDIKREIKNVYLMYVPIFYHYKKCSLYVKLKLNKAFCLSF